MKAHSMQRGICADASQSPGLTSRGQRVGQDLSTPSVDAHLERFIRSVGNQAAGSLLRQDAPQGATRRAQGSDNPSREVTHPVVFHQDETLETEPGPAAESRATGASKVVEGFTIDSKYCGCIDRVQKEIDWVETMIGIYGACKDEVASGNHAAEAVACKKRKLTEIGIETEQAGHVDWSDGDESVEQQSGLCGPVLTHGIRIHESIHTAFREEKKELLGIENDDDIPIDAGEYSGNELEAYGKEKTFLKAAAEAITELCKAGRFTTDPDYLREQCSDLDFDLGLDRAPGSPFNRLTVHDDYPGLRSQCWWYLGPNGGGYNCFGYCFHRGGELSVVEPKGTYKELLAKRDFVKSEGVGELALYDGGHVACKSEHTHDGRQLWESKLGPDGPLILHELDGLEGRFYGRVVGYYSRAEDKTDESSGE